jgi:hypothetical protein
MRNLALADLIHQGESVSDGYNAYNRGTAGGRVLGAKFKRSLVTSRLNAILADMALTAENTNRLFAVGRYQLIPTTFKDAIERLKLDKTAVFDEALQDRILCDYLLKIKRHQIYDYVCGLSSDIKAAALAASEEWASIADPNTGYSHYGNGNVASITAAQINTALKNARVAYTEMGQPFEKAVFHD